MKINAKQIAVFFPLLFLIVIGFTKLNGSWITESTKQPGKFETGEFAGVNNPADIKGSYSLLDIKNAFSIPVETLAEAFGFSQEDHPEEIKVKELETLYGSAGELEIGTDSVRWFAALYLGLPFVPEDSTGLPRSAWSLLQQNKALDNSQQEEFKSRIVDLSVTNHEVVDQSVTTHEVLEEKLLKGNTLFSDLLEWGLSKDEIEEILQNPMGKGSQTVRDYSISLGMEFSSVKSALQELIDSK